ncbi:MAG: hypothetical protein HRK26_00065 [Rickettsiaceae bacterium H1]|nr:hypothetical protein [Rickettsiaceae bacterium H1]
MTELTQKIINFISSLNDSNKEENEYRVFMEDVANFLAYFNDLGQEERQKFTNLIAFLKALNQEQDPKPQSLEDLTNLIITSMGLNENHHSKIHENVTKCITSLSRDLNTTQDEDSTFIQSLTDFTTLLSNSTKHENSKNPSTVNQ